MKRALIILFAVVMVGAWVLPSYAVDIEQDGEYRVRFVYANNGNDLDGGIGDVSDNINQRFRYGIKAIASDELWAYLQLSLMAGCQGQFDGGGNYNVGRGGVGNYTWGEGVASCLPDGNDEFQPGRAWRSDAGIGVAARQAYIVFKLGSVTNKLGRQYFKHPGDPFSLLLEADLDMWLISAPIGDALVYAAYSKVIEVDRATATPAGPMPGGASNDEDMDIWLIGVRGEPADGISAGIHWTYVRDATWSGPRNGNGIVCGTCIDPMDDHYIGADVALSLGNFEIAVEGVYLQGEVYDLATTSTRNTGAWAVIGRVQTMIDRFGIGIMAGMGTGEDGTTADHDQWRDISGSMAITEIFFDQGRNSNLGSLRRPGTGGATSVASLSGRTLDNVFFIAPYVHVKLSDDTRIKLLYAYISCSTDCVPGGVAGDNDDVGSEFDVVVNHRLVGSNSLWLRLSAAWFMPDEGYRDALEWGLDGVNDGDFTEDDVVSQYWAKLQWKWGTK